MKRFLEHGHFLEIEPGVEIYYEDVGKGDPILFVPGLSFTGEVFSKQIEHFSKNYRVITIDPRSQGLSTKTVYGNHFDKHGEDLDALVNHLQLENVTLVGWSTGNLSVWSYIKQFGTANVKATITIDMSPTPMSDRDGDWVECSFDELSEVATQLFTSQKGQRAFMYDYGKNVMLEHATEEQLAKVLEMSSHTPYYLIHTIFVNAVLCDMSEGAEKADEEVPSMMFIAEHWSDIAEPYMNKHYPHTETHVQGGHMMYWEYADTFNEKVEEFLKKQ